MFWRQKARVKCLNNDDRNSKFFHAVVAEHRSKSMIHRIKSNSGEWLDREEDISREAMSFFQELFSAQSDPLSVQELFSAQSDPLFVQVLDDIASLSSHSPLLDLMQ